MTDFDPVVEADDGYLEATIAPSQYHSQESELLLQRLRDLIDAAPSLPLSNTPRIARDEVLDMVDEILVRLPEELRAARWLLKEREEYLAKMRHEGDEILAQSRDRAERMVQRTEVVKAAEQRAYQILDTAETEARRLRHEVEDFCDQKLASFEIVLERTMTMVASGRAKLQGTNLVADIPIDEDEEAGSDFSTLPPPPLLSQDLFDRED